MNSHLVIRPQVVPDPRGGNRRAPSLRNQKGGLRLRSGFWLVQYYATVVENGIPLRKRVSQKLARKDERYYSVKCKALKDLQAEFMRKVNADSGTLPAAEVLISDFWTDTYLPFLTDNQRASTVRGYEHLWKLRLANHFAGRTLGSYRASHGTELLNSLATKLSRNSISHARSLASGLFSHAVALDLLEANPWRAAKLLAKPKPTPPTKHYTVTEIENIISALSDRADAQLLFALAFYVGLRTSEIEWLRWEDFKERQGWVHVRRGVDGGELKTKESDAFLPLIKPVLLRLSSWWEKSGNPSEGWLFPGQADKPMNVHSFNQRVTRPLLEKKGLEWKGLYAGRRGGLTELTNLTGSPQAAQQQGRHKNMGITMTHYIKNDQRALVAGVKLLEERATQKEEEGR